MVGPLNTPEVTPPQSPAPEGGIMGFFSSRAGKLVIGGIIVVAILGALAVAAVFFVFRPSDAPVTPDPTGAAVSTTATPEATEAAAQRPDPRLSDTFTFRNIFAPTVKPSVPPSSSSDATPGAQVPDDLPPDTLFLASIAIVDGEPVGTFFWNGTQFAAGEGDELSGTPWKVISLDGDTAVMLYGDSQVTLTVGQGTAK